MSDETLRILKLLEAGRITAAEAEELLKAVKDSPKSPEDEDTNNYIHPGRIIASVMPEVNPGKMVSDVMNDVMKNIRSHHYPKMPKRPHPPEMPGCCFGSHSAEEERVVTMPAEGIRTLALNQPRSDIKVSGCDSDQIVIRARVQVWGDDEDEAQERLKSLQVSTDNDGGTLRIKLDGPPWTKKRRSQVDFDLKVPKGLALELGTASGDIEITDMGQSLRAQTASGQLSLFRCRGRAEIFTASGDIEIRDLSPESEVEARTASGDLKIKSAGRFVLHTVSGDIQAEIGQGSCLASSVSGDIGLKMSDFQSLALSSTSGDLEVTLSSTPQAQVRLESVSGDISLDLPAEASAEIEALTASGDIDCDTEMLEPNRTGRRLSGRLGDGRTKIMLRTTSGDIDIE